MHQNANSQPPTHVFEMPIHTEPTAVVVKASNLPDLGIELEAPCPTALVMLTREGIFAIDGDA